MAIGGKQFLMDKDYFPPCLRIDILIGSPDTKMREHFKIERVLIDTGSDLTIIPNEIIKKLKLKMIGIRELEHFNGEYVTVKIYSGEIRIDGIVKGIYEIGGVDSEALIGMDLIKDWHVLIDGPKGTFEIANKHSYKMPQL